MTDIEIAHSVTPTHIKEVASKIEIDEEVLEFYGKYKANLSKPTIFWRLSMTGSQKTSTVLI